MKYAFIQIQATEFPVKALCRVLDVAHSGYYAWRSRSPSQRLHWRAQLDQQVAQAYAAHKGRSGAPRLCHDLQEVGLTYNRKTVAASLRKGCGPELLGNSRLRRMLTTGCR